MPVISCYRLGQTVLLAVCVLAAGSADLHAQSVGPLVADPSAVTLNAPTPVTFTLAANDPLLIPQSVNLLRLQGSGLPPALVGQMRDDGANGDAVAADRIFTLRLTVTGTSYSPHLYSASVAFRGRLTRVLSTTAAVNVWARISRANIGIAVNYPANWMAQATSSQDTLRLGNVATTEPETTRSLVEESLFEVNRRRGRNPNELPIDQWFDTYFQPATTEPYLERSLTVIAGRAAVRIDTMELVRTRHVYIPDGADILEVVYKLNNAQYTSIYEGMLRSLEVGSPVAWNPKRSPWATLHAWLRPARLLASVPARPTLPTSRWRNGWNTERGMNATGRLPLGSSAVGTSQDVDRARTKLGNPYEYNAKFTDEDPGGAFDCSEFVKWVYPELGDVARDQEAKDVGTRLTGPSLKGLVDDGTLKAGDVLFYDFNGDGKVDHTGIYTGDGMMIHASPGAKKVVEIPLDSYDGWENHFVSARRPRGDPPVKTNSLTVSVTGDGRIRSIPVGIDCPGTCAAAFPTSASVQLTAEPGNGLAFAGWSGDCTGYGCSVSMNIVRAVSATFVAPGLYVGQSFVAEYQVGFGNSWFRHKDTFKVDVEISVGMLPSGPVVRAFALPATIDREYQFFNIVNNIVVAGPITKSLSGSCGAVLMTTSASGFSADRFPECAANGRAAITLTPTNSTTFSGTFRLRNENVPPWNIPAFYQFDTGTLLFTATK